MVGVTSADIRLAAYHGACGRELGSECRESERTEHLQVLGIALDRLQRRDHGPVGDVSADLDIEDVVPALALHWPRLQLLQIDAALGEMAKHAEERTR